MHLEMTCKTETYKRLQKNKPEESLIILYKQNDARIIVFRTANQCFCKTL